MHQKVHLVLLGGKLTPGTTWLLIHLVGSLGAKWLTVDGPSKCTRWCCVVFAMEGCEQMNRWKSPHPRPPVSVYFTVETQQKHHYIKIWVISIDCDYDCVSWLTALEKNIYLTSVICSDTAVWRSRVSWGRWWDSTPIIATYRQISFLPKRLNSDQRLIICCHETAIGKTSKCFLASGRRVLMSCVGQTSWGSSIGIHTKWIHMSVYSAPWEFITVIWGFEHVSKM